MTTKKKAPGKQLTKKQIKDSPALKRLIEEVRVEPPGTWGGYNRTYHRHNR